MLQALEAIEHLGEVVRLFLVLTSHNKSRMEEQALIDACKRTAGLATRYPRPSPALAIATATGLLSRTRESVRITSRGQKFASQGIPGILDLTQPQAKLLLAAMLDDASVHHTIASLVSHFQLVHGKLQARKSSVQGAHTNLLLCRLLQQLGAISSSGDYYVIAKPFDDLLSHLIIAAAKLTQAELFQRLESQRQRGDLAEQKVEEIERTRLQSLGRPDLAARVERISLQDVSAGYDINSFEKNDNPRLIEVKSSVGSQINFEWSTGERAAAAEHGDAYYIYFVPFSFTLPELISPVALLKNPVKLLRTGRLAERPSSFHVTESLAKGTPPSKGHPSPPPETVTYVYC